MRYIELLLLILLSFTLSGQVDSQGTRGLASNEIRVFTYDTAVAIAKKESKLILLSPLSDIKPISHTVSKTIVIRPAQRDSFDKYFVLASKPIKAQRTQTKKKSDVVGFKGALHSTNQAIILIGLLDKLHIVLDTTDSIQNLVKMPVIDDYININAKIQDLKKSTPIVSKLFAKIQTDPKAEDIYQLWRYLQQYDILSGYLSHLFFAHFDKSDLYKQAGDILITEHQHNRNDHQLFFEDNFEQLSKYNNREDLDYIARRYATDSAIRERHVIASPYGDKKILRPQKIKHYHFKYMNDKRRVDSLVLICTVEKELFKFERSDKTRVSKELVNASKHLMNYNLENYKFRNLLFKNLIFYNRNKKNLEIPKYYLRKRDLNSSIINNDLLAMIYFKLGKQEVSKMYLSKAEAIAKDLNIKYKSSIALLSEDLSKAEMQYLLSK